LYFNNLRGGGVKAKFFIALLLAIGLKINLTKAQTLSLFSLDTVLENKQFTIKNTSSGYSGNAVFTLSISDIIGTYVEKDTTLFFSLFQGDSIYYKYDKVGLYTISITDGVDTIQKTISVKAIITLPCSTYCAQFNYQNCENICNGSFEDFTYFNPIAGGFLFKACPWGTDEINYIPSGATGYIQFGSPDLYSNQFPNSNYGLPGSNVGYQSAFFGGGAFAGIITEGGTNSSCIYREYIRQKLNQPLVPGAVYKVSMRVSLAEGSKKATPIHIALCSSFQFASLNYTGGCATPISNLSTNPTCIKATSGTITDKAAWTEVSGTFTASTTNPEQYILIGLFNSPNYVGTSVTQTPGYGTNLQAAMANSSYYFIDAVSITPVFCCPADVSYGTSETFTMNSSQLNLISGQSLAFYGTLTLNTNFTLNNNHIKFRENSKIVVPSGRVLTIDNFSLLETCGNYLWKGIEVQPGGSIVVKQGSTIKDALAAVTLNGVCNAQIENSFFQNNVKHISVNSVSSGTHPAQIYGNIFSCSALKGSFNGTITQAAIELQNVNFVKIGNTLGLGFQNVYSGASVGIKAIASGFEMYNNKFMNIGCVSNYPAGTACSFGGLNSNYAVYVKNLGANTPKNVFIGNILCPNGQYCNNTFINGDGGIFANGAMNFYAANNTFQNYKEKGITVRNNGCADCKTIVSNNLFSTSGSINSPGAVEVLEYNRARVSVSNNIINRSQAKNDSKAIFISNSTIPGVGQLVAVMRNQITKFDYGVHLLNSNYPSVIENHITTDDASSWFYPEGIRVENSQKAFIQNNTVIEALPNKMGYGIRVESPPSAGVYCNNITDARIAMFYGGFNYTSTVAANYMTTCKNGFYVNWGEIGLQGPGKWSYLNAWIGPIADWNSHFLVYGTNDPAFDGNKSRLNLKVPGSIYYPGGASGFKSLAQGIPLPNQMIPVETSTDLTNPFEVPSFVTQCRDLNQDLLLFSPRISEYVEEGDSSRYENDSTGYGSAAAQAAHLFMIRNLYEDSTGIFMQEIGDTLANELFQSSVGRFLSLIYRHQNGDSTATATAASTISTSTRADSLMAEATFALFQWKETEIDTTVDSLMIVNLMNMAILCPYEYGEGVYIARGILAYIYSDLLFANPCEQTDYEMLERSGKNNKKDENYLNLIVYPNPTNGLINILMNPYRKNPIHRIEIYNYFGIKVNDVLEPNAIDGVIRIDVSNFSAGIYLLKVFKTDNTFEVTKVIKQ